ncbi:MAG: hypothetical protein HY403_12100, partial [Elusimicrobia bacterium]|nr:hypothetical protein [Elusimicrobiota bacterium]
AAAASPLLAPAIAAAAELGQSAALDPAFLTVMAFSGAIGAIGGAGAGVVLAVSISDVYEMSARLIDKFVITGSAIGLAAAAVGAAYGPETFNGVMIALASPIVLLVCALAVKTVKDLLRWKP